MSTGTSLCRTQLCWEKELKLEELPCSKGGGKIKNPICVDPVFCLAKFSVDQVAEKNPFSTPDVRLPVITHFPPCLPVSGRSAPVTWWANQKAKAKPWRRRKTGAKRRPTRAVCPTTIVAQWLTERGTRAWFLPDQSRMSLPAAENTTLTFRRDVKNQDHS